MSAAQKRNRRIDGVRFKNADAVISCTTGAGEHEETWTYEGITFPDGVTHFLYSEEGKHWLYRELDTPPSPADIAATHESTSAVRMKFGKRRNEGTKSARRTATLSWATVKERFADAPPPFENADEVMIISGDDPAEKRAFMSVGLEETDSGFYSARCPASEMEADALPEGRIGASHEVAVIVAAGLLVAALVFAFFTGNPVPLQVFWWGGVPVGLLSIMTNRGNLVHAPATIISAAFFFHFATHGLDVWISADWNEGRAIAFESGRAAALVVLMALLRPLLQRTYAVVADGSIGGGGLAFVLFVVGGLLGNLESEGSFASWFRWYAGAPPWGFIWPVILCAGIWLAYRRHRSVPLSSKSLRSALYRLSQALGAGFGNALTHSDDLVRWADELGEATRFSRDRKVVALLPLAPAFANIAEAIGNLQKVDTDHLIAAERALIEADLQTMAGDLGALLEGFNELGKGAKPVPGPRVSPFLLTYGQ